MPQYEGIRDSDIENVCHHAVYNGRRAEKEKKQEIIDILLVNVNVVVMEKVTPIK